MNDDIGRRLGLKNHKPFVRHPSLDEPVPDKDKKPDAFLIQLKEAAALLPFRDGAVVRVKGLENAPRMIVYAAGLREAVSPELAVDQSSLIEIAGRKYSSFVMALWFDGTRNLVQAEFSTDLIERVETDGGYGR